MFRMITGVVLFLSLYLALNVYVGAHGLFVLEWFNLTISPYLYWTLYVLLALSYLVARLPFVRGVVQSFILRIAVWFIAVFYFSLLILPFIDVAYLMNNRWFILNQQTMMIGSISIYMISIALIVVRGYWNATHPIMREYELTAHRQAEQGRNIRIIVASDLHLGYIVGINHLRKLEKIVAKSKPDVILLPGDAVDDDPQAFIESGMAEVMRQIVHHSRFGVFAVLGNHEYYGGQIERYVELMNEIGVRVLRDEAVAVEENSAISFYILGRKDFTEEQMRGQRKSISELTTGLCMNLPVILMDHQPRALTEAADCGIDLLLCGHTHRGQFAPNHWITRVLFELDWGYMQKKQTHIIVSSGFGTWGPPLRLASRSEVIAITLKI